MFRRSSSGDTPASRVASGSTVRLVCIRFSRDRKSTRLNSSHDQISYAVFCLKKKNNGDTREWTPMAPLGTPEYGGNEVSLLCWEKDEWIMGQGIYAESGGSLMNTEIAIVLQ